MPTGRRRSPSSVLVQKGSIEQAGSLLQQLPDKPKDTWSLREAIRQLQDDITLALNRGYSHDEVAKMLSDKGVKISPSSLKSYLAATRKETEGATKTRRGRRRATEPAPEVEEAAPKRRGRRPASAAPATKTAAKTRTRSTAKAAPAVEKPTTKGTRGRRRKDA